MTLQNVLVWAAVLSSPAQSYLMRPGAIRAGVRTRSGDLAATVRTAWQRKVQSQTCPKSTRSITSLVCPRASLTREHQRVRAAAQHFPGRSASILLRGGVSTASQTTTRTAMTAATMDPPTKEDQPVERFRKDYRPPDYRISKTELDFLLGDGETVVHSRLHIEPNGDGSHAPLVLDGEELELRGLRINGKSLEADTDYALGKESLEIKASAIPSGPFTLEAEVAIVPETNTKLTGLYKSGPMYCTQCEAHGFRRITYYQDRPDVMSKFKVRVEADKAAYPILLSNGNKIQEGDVEGAAGRHFAVWEDPFIKPSYLFALVAGDLGSITDSYTTTSGRKVHLEIFSEKHNVKKLDWAMQSLKAAMKWDEDTYGLEYDLDLFNIVAVDSFNMGAMENKGLNVFNSALVLANPSTATDLDYERIEGVIGHEYFHNWTGNRVTCRDWFQLTLKEGLTVARDQQFSGDMGSQAVKRIEDVRGLRARQFPEDAGPLAHPIRPESYISMDNFYTATVYSKGAEVIGMYKTLLGTQGFRKGMDLYFQRHDGQAVTADDFRAAMADANGADLVQFERWYLQAGTPVVEAKGSYDASAKTYTLTLRQSTPPTPKQPTKEPFHIPVTTGLLLKDGSEAVPSRVLELKQEQQTFEFTDIPSEPIPSLLRDFSAPVKLRYDYSDADLAFLMAHDTDSFNRWEAGQQLAQRVILNLVDKVQQGEELGPLPPHLVDSFRTTLTQTGVDKSVQAYALQLPSLSTLAEEMKVIDPDALTKASKHVSESLAKALKDEFRRVYDSLAFQGEYVKNPEEVGRRRLRNTCLVYLHKFKDQEAVDLCYAQFEAANCMTDKVAALGCLVDIPSEKTDRALQKFYDDAAGDALVLNKWFGLQAGASVPDLLDRVKALMQHKDFTLKNPNRLRSVVSVFAMTMDKFHAKDGSGYEFLGKLCVDIDRINPQVAARLTSVFSQWRRFDQGRQDLMKAQLQAIKDSPGLSKDTFEVATRCLG